MSERVELENWVIEQFSEVKNYGFSEPIIRRDDDGLTIDWLQTTIGLELELDWREFDVFLLIVKLNNQNLPDGYYMSNGKPCRIHLQTLVKERGWMVAEEEMRSISSGGKRQHASVDTLKELVHDYKVVLMRCITKLLSEKESIFSA